jgi:hypothetical protein
VRRACVWLLISVYNRWHSSVKRILAAPFDLLCRGKAAIIGVFGE